MGIISKEKKQLLGSIIDVIDDFLEERGVILDSSEQEKKESDPKGWSENSAVIYGSDYEELETSIDAVLEAYFDGEYRLVDAKELDREEDDLK